MAFAASNLFPGGEKLWMMIRRRQIVDVLYLAAWSLISGKCRSRLPSTYSSLKSSSSVQRN